LKDLIDAIRRARGFARLDPDGDPGPPEPLEDRRVLLVYLFPALGDAALIAPVAKALLDAGAKPPIGLLVRASAARILKLVDLPLRLHVLDDALALPAPRRDRPELEKAWKKKEVKLAAAKLEEELSRRDYHVAVDLTFRDDADARRWVVASGASLRLGWCEAGEDLDRARLSRGTIDTRWQAERHWSRYQLLPLRCLGVSQPSYEIAFQEKPAAAARAEGLWGPGRRILLVPGARNEVKRWDPGRFAEVGREVVGPWNDSVVVVGAPGEAALVKGLVKAIGPGAGSYVGKDLATLVALVKSAHAVVTNDTGPMHLAYLTGRPTVALFTWMSPVCWGPPTKDPRHVVLHAPARDQGAHDPGGVWTRAVLHHLARLLDAFGPKPRRAG
jgi:ADP-heptose:LPS heptosyltransferase